MRRMTWILMVVAAAALMLPTGGPAVAQVTVPGPDFNNDSFGFSLDTGQFEGGDALVVGAAGGAGAASEFDDLGGTPQEQLLHQGVSGLGGVAESTDVFGAALS